jgi:hypothetical protein
MLEILLWLAWGCACCMGLLCANVGHLCEIKDFFYVRGGPGRRKGEVVGQCMPREFFSALFDGIEVWARALVWGEQTRCFL